MSEENNNFTFEIPDFKIDTEDMMKCRSNYVYYVNKLCVQEQQLSRLQALIQNKKKAAEKALLEAYRKNYDVVWVIKKIPKKDPEFIETNIWPFLSKKDCENYIQDDNNNYDWKSICVPRCPTELSDRHLLGLQKYIPITGYCNHHNLQVTIPK